jgi:uncharacterized protein (DUF433 family)
VKDGLACQVKWAKLNAMKAMPMVHEAAGGVVVSDPEILGGTPVFRGTRLPVATLFDYLGDGRTVDYYLETFPSATREQVLGLLRYGQQRIERELSA